MAEDGKMISGTFADYNMGSAQADYPDDDTAVEDASYTMFSCCGNPGQEALIGDNMEWFNEWGIEILEDESSNRGTTFGEFADMVLNDIYDGDLEKWWGTYEIWNEGWSQIAAQSGYHDSDDEEGEGTGREF